MGATERGEGRRTCVLCVDRTMVCPFNACGSGAVEDALGVFGARSSLAGGVEVGGVSGGLLGGPPWSP